MHSADHVVMSKSVVHKQNIEVEELAHLHNMIRHTFVRRTSEGVLFHGWPDGFFEREDGGQGRRGDTKAYHVKGAMPRAYVRRAA